MKKPVTAKLITTVGSVYAQFGNNKTRKLLPGTEVERNGAKFEIVGVCESPDEDFIEARASQVPGVEVARLDTRKVEHWPSWTRGTIG